MRLPILSSIIRTCMQSKKGGQGNCFQSANYEDIEQNSAIKIHSIKSTTFPFTLTPTTEKVVPRSMPTAAVIAG